MDTDRILKLSVYSPDKAIEFLTSKVGFSVLHNEFTITEPKEIIVRDKEGNNYLISDVRKTHIPNDEKMNTSNIILTRDCLKDYFFLSAAGVVFEDTPKYSNDALSIKIVDRWGNRYILMERRMCNDD